MTGLTFAKFSRPTARVRFTRYAVIGPRDGKSSLVIRMANIRANRIVEAQINLTFARQEITLEGETIRRFYDLPTTRNRSPLFMLSWTAVHVITEDSPFFGQNPESLAPTSPEIVVSITGLDQTFSQTVHARHSYKLGGNHLGRPLRRRTENKPRRHPLHRLRPLRRRPDARPFLIQIFSLSKKRVRDQLKIKYFVPLPSRERVRGSGLPRIEQISDDAPQRPSVCVSSWRENSLT